MKLIDILVEELPKRGGWPEDVAAITQDSDNATNNYKNADGLEINKHGSWRCSSAWEGYSLRASDSPCLASDYDTAIITREQYEDALAAKNDGWIELGGGECPVEKGTLVDVKYRCGDVNLHIKAGEPDSAGSIDTAFAVRWSKLGAEYDIIAYLLRQSQEVAQIEAELEADLNECIGQATATEWNGEGLPPVGCECERSWAGDEWMRCEILFMSHQIVVIKLKESGIEDAYNIGDVAFRQARPERTEAEIKREEAVKAITLTGWCQSAAEKIYDLVAAGKVPGIKLED